MTYAWAELQTRSTGAFLHVLVSAYKAMKDWPRTELLAQRIPRRDLSIEKTIVVGVVEVG